ncbi:unnamed protein product [Sphagnum troendelagicum]|uniref:Uncharacterized protein n=1 Tax=Sphagnum troendelagicum TaxID=128251 RepID=A0ABP0T9X0_9BRYO
MVNYKVEELRLGLEKNKNNPMMMIMVYHRLLQESNIATDSTLNSSSANNHCLAALSSAEVGTHKSIPIAFLDAYMKDEGPAIDSNLGQYEDAVSVLERSLTIPDVNQGEQHALAIFAGHMQLGDALNLAGKQGPAMEFVDAKKMCGHALLIHTNHCDSGSLEEDQYHKLLVTIHTAEGDHGKALDSLVYANSIFVKHAKEVDVATTNSSIGDCLLALGCDGEALLCYEKVLMDFKNLKGDNHSLVASVFVNLAEFHLRLTNLVRQNLIVKLHSGAMENRELDIHLEMLLMGWLTLLPFLRN